MKKVFICSVLMFSVLPRLHAQDAVNFALQAAKEKGGTLHLLVSGDAGQIRKAVAMYGGHYKYQTGNIHSILLPAASLTAFSRHAGIEHISFNSHTYHLLNDSMVYNSNIVPVHTGANPLPQAYRGKDVVIGILDSGIEIDHPDFSDSLGNTRILAIWDHRYPADTNSPLPYGYGQLWDSAAINAQLCPHHDSTTFNGHGTHVAGIAAGNGLSVNHFEGVAPESDILVASLDFWSPGFEARLADAVHWMFHFADSIGKPCVINASVGDYLGSHDGRDDATLIIDSLLDEHAGRAFVCAAGNSGKMPPYHLGYTVPSDTAFTWFIFNPSTAQGYPGYYFELWADEPDFSNVEFAFGMDQTTPAYSFRGSTAFDNIQNRLNVTYLDSITNINGDVLAYVETWAELYHGRYLLQVKVDNPDSSQYRLRFMTRGSGRFDLWSSAWNGMNDMVSTGLPDAVTFPEITHYEKPDSNKTIVSDWACSAHTITTANYTNRDRYIDYNNVLQTYTETPGAIEASSSFGPTRTGSQKPDVAAAGGRVLSCGTIEILNWMYVNLPSKVAQGGWHKTNGGTSMASPQVAGSVALLLQRCPWMNWQEIKQSITAPAKQDGFTGNTPNYRWGSGKLDAFASMQNIAFKPHMLPNDSSVHFCEGDSIFLSVSGTFDTYLWSTGQTSQGIWITQAGDYAVTVSSNSGCYAGSDTLIAQLDSLPPTPFIIQNADTLSTANASAYQWYLNGNILTGDTSQTLVISQSGYYQVLITGSNGCQNISDSLYVVYSSTETFYQDAGISVFPNPAGRQLTIETQGKKGKTIAYSLYGLLGEPVASGLLPVIENKESMLIDLHHYAPGIYFLHLATENLEKTIKIIHYQP